MIILQYLKIGFSVQYIIILETHPTMYKFIVLLSAFLFINDINAQYRTPGDMIPQTTKLTPQSPTYKIIRNAPAPPVGLANQQTQPFMNSKRYTFRKVTGVPSNPTRRHSKRQQVAQTLKQHVIKNLIAARTVLNKEPLSANPLMKNMVAPTNVASDIKVLRP